MVVMLKAKAPTAVKVPDGIYKAKLSKVNQFSNVYGERIGFEFTLESGEKVMRSTSPVLSDKGQLANVLRGLLGRDLTRDEMQQGVDAEELVGTYCMVVVRQSTSKAGQVFSNIEAVLPMKKE